MHRLGFDIGGTFTDFVLLDETTGQLAIHKTLTTYPDPSVGALQGLAALCAAQGIGMSDLAGVIHATTLVTNALIERRGARIGLLTTRGFRDILEMGFEQRYDVYDLFLQFPEPLVPRRLRREVNERITATGAVVQPLDLDEVRAQVADLVAGGCTAVAVVFLHAYKNPVHEQQARDWIRREFPRLYVSISSEVVPEIREYPRTCTTAANAYVQPLMDHYLSRLEQALGSGGYQGRFYLMQSAGGTASASMARAYPVRLLESGPAAGALATAFFGALIGRRDLVSFDMGGTTAKLALVEGGKPAIAPLLEAARVHRFKKGSGIPIKAPAVDLMEIGAGGGSIAYVGELGTLRVGPQSAAADPGPACYGLGGRQPTVTDADLVLGYLNPDYFLGGRITLDVDAAREALRRTAEPLGLDPVTAAWGVYSVVNENMAGAARVHIVEKNRDPRRYAMVAFGGAGPVHACRVARILGMPEVIVPQAAGAASALGLLVAPLSFDLSTSQPAPLDDVDWAEVNALYADMEQRARSLLVEAGVPEHAVAMARTAEMRLLGQVHEIIVPVPNGELGVAVVGRIAEDFTTEYKRLYSHLAEGNRIQVLSWRLSAAGPAPQVALGQAGAEGVTGGPERARRGERPAYFPETDGYASVPVYNRYQLAPGDVILGPAIVEERECTTVVGPGDVLRVDAYRNLVIAIHNGKGGVGDDAHD